MADRMKDVLRDAYHYTDSGLDNIWLLHGFDRHQTPYGPATSIRDIDALHQSIAMSIVKSEKMTGQEFRFLRIELDLSQRALAGLLKATEQQVHRWENSKSKVPGPAQVALSNYYVATQNPESSLKELMDELAQLDADITELDLRLFELEGDDWVPTSPVAA
ncbi:MAG: hypothetical protein WAS32_15210 [Tabrizicola sp.]